MTFKPRGFLILLLSLELALSPALALAQNADSAGIPDCKDCQKFELAKSHVSETKKTADEICKELLKDYKVTDIEKYPEAFANSNIDSNQILMTASLIRCGIGVLDFGWDIVKGVWDLAKLHESMKAYLLETALKVGSNEFEVLKKIVKGHYDLYPDAVAASAVAADVGVAALQPAIETIEEYYPLITQLAQSLIKEIGLQFDKSIDTFKCGGVSIKSQMLCRAMAEIIALLFPILKSAKVAQGAKYLTATAGELRKIAQLGLRAGLEASARFSGPRNGLKSVTALRLALEEFLGRMQTEVVTELTPNLRLESRVNRLLGEQELFVNIKDANGHWQYVDKVRLAVNSNTGLISAQEKIGQRVMYLVIEDAAKGAVREPAQMIFLDSNNLGAINYFADAEESGNTMLKVIGKAIRHPGADGRAGDIAFNLGGDEMVIVAKNLKNGDANTVIQRINRAMESSPEIKELFAKEHRIRETELQLFERAQKYEDIAETMKARFPTNKYGVYHDLAKTPEGFADIKRALVAKWEDALAALEKMQGDPGVKGGYVNLADPRYTKTPELAVKEASQKMAGGDMRVSFKTKSGVQVDLKSLFKNSFDKYLDWAVKTRAGK